MLDKSVTPLHCTLDCTITISLQQRLSYQAFNWSLSSEKRHIKNPVSGRSEAAPYLVGCLALWLLLAGATTLPIASICTNHNQKGGMASIFIQGWVLLRGHYPSQYVWPRPLFGPSSCQSYAVQNNRMQNKRMNSLLVFLQGYYPERLGTLFILNAPFIFGAVWKVVSPFIDSRTRKKVRAVPRLLLYRSSTSPYTSMELWRSEP
jgi:hypothetical protein